MLKWLIHLFLFSIVLYYFCRRSQCISWFQLEQEYDSSELKEENQLENVNNFLETSSEHVEEVVNKKEDFNNEMKNFYDNSDKLVQDKVKYDDFVKSVDNYVQRYINLFLITSNLLNYEVTNENEEITFDLEISISGQDLAYLQEYSNKTKTSSHLRNFSKLDKIFSKIARAKEKSYMKKALSFSESILEYLNIFNVLNNSSFKTYFTFLTICISIWTFLHFFLQYTTFFLVIIINSAIIWEGLNKYWQKIKESDIELYVKTLQLKDVPVNCDSSKMGLYDRFMNFFYEDKCLQYYKTLNKNPVDEVSLFNCIFDTYVFYLIRTPLKLFGSSIRDITGEISGLWPWPFGYFINIPMVPIIAVMLAFFILILCGKRLKISLLGAAVEIAGSETKSDSYKTINENPKPIRIIRKLKPWTKTKVPRRLEIESLKRRKLYLKSAFGTEVQNGKECEPCSVEGDVCSTKVAGDH